MYNPIEVNQAAEKAREELEKSGQVGRTKIGRKTVWEETTAQTVLLEGMNAYIIPIYGSTGVKAGDKVTVIFDGEQYVCTAVEIDGLVGFGNFGLIGGAEDTGEPFVYSDITGSGFTGGLLTTQGEHTYSASVTVETIHPIDPKYLPKGGVGYEESTVLTHDGNNEGKEVLAGDFPFARIADVIDPTAIVEITMLFNGTTLNITADELTITGNDYYKAVSYAGNAGIMIWYEGNTAGASAGTYVVSSLEAQTYVSRIVCKTTHKIEQKFLPGVCLPVVELSTTLPADVGGFTADESAQLIEAAKSKCFILLFNTACAALCRPYEEDGVVYFVGTFIDGTNNGVSTMVGGTIKGENVVPFFMPYSNE